MFPMRYSTIFKSRWWALVWAAGILWTAYDVADAQPQGNASGNNAAASADDTGAPMTPEQAQDVNEALNAF
jgi:hypothetical protein